VSRLVLRDLRGVGEFQEAQEVARRAWGFADRQLTAISDLLALCHGGALAAGAFEGGELLGFVFGFPRTNVGQPCQHSHLLAVKPAAQGRGLSTRLKLYQRRWCLDRGIRLVTWTYDPLLARNAQLNISRLRARAEAYLCNFYGPMGGIYGDLPTDRFEVYWHLDDPAVEAAARGSRSGADGLESWPRLRPGGRLAGPRVAVEIPLGAPRLYSDDPVRARRARMEMRRLALRLFSKGYVASSFAASSGFGLYGFSRR
jgi:chorismate synthase